jgi:hypothetical protein
MRKITDNKQFISRTFVKGLLGAFLFRKKEKTIAIICYTHSSHPTTAVPPKPVLEWLIDPKNQS